MHINKAELSKAYKNIYQNTCAQLRYFFAPGRVNLIGEHIDYNGGHVFPCALNIGTYAVVGYRADKQICFYSANFADSGMYCLDLTQPLEKSTAITWVNYCIGVIKHFIAQGYELTHGLNIYIHGNIPNGAGVSSSASLEILMAIILNEIFNFAIDKIELVKWCQAVENNFIGVNCGIMDQFAIMMSKPQQALLINCDTLDYHYANFALQDYTLVIANTNKRRTLADSKYNERKSECDTVLAIVQQLSNYQHLAHIPLDLLPQCLTLITDETLQKRLSHVVSEQYRTQEAFAALNSGELTKFGELMNQSHLSLQHDYAVTGFELDTLVKLAWNFTGCIGARMTGAGFGGCTINLVAVDKVADFIAQVGSKYYAHTQLNADFYVTSASNGAQEI